MTIELLQYISIGAYVASGIFFVAAVIIFFVLRIPDVIGDLSGRTARRAIEDIRNRNESTGEKAYKSSAANINRGKLTQKISTMKLDTAGGATTVLENEADNETTVLKSEVNSETTVLKSEVNSETTVLGTQTDNETTVLSGSRVPAVDNEAAGKVTVIAELMFAQSTEIVE